MQTLCWKESMIALKLFGFYLPQASGMKYKVMLIMEILITLCVPCNIMPVWSRTLSANSQLQLLMRVQTLDGRNHAASKLRNIAVQETKNTKERPKRSSDTEYDYYKDTDYYTYYGVEDPVRYFDVISTSSAPADRHLCWHFMTASPDL